jgi:sugar lactone lactonase YvrE
MARVDLAADCKANLGESPIWEARSGRLYHIDINGKTLYAYEPSTNSAPCLPTVLPTAVGTIVPRAAGGLLACLEEHIVTVNPDTRVVGLPLASVPPEHRARAARRGVCLRAQALDAARACSAQALDFAGSWCFAMC